MRKFDKGVLELVSKYGIIYTRYADDIMQSSKMAMDEKVKDYIYTEIEKLLADRKLKINKKKSSYIKLSAVGQCQIYWA